MEPQITQMTQIRNSICERPGSSDLLVPSFDKFLSSNLFHLRSSAAQLNLQSEIFNLQSPYSYLNATSGSTLVALRAGRYEAMSATAVSSSETTTNVVTS